MDVKLFSLCKQDSAEAQAGMNHIRRCVKAFFSDCEDFNNFTSQKRILLAVAQSLRAADIVVIAVQSNMYNATKKLLASAVDLKIAKNRTVSAALSTALETGKIKQNIFDSNIRFPHGSVIMPTDDYINCGFALSAGGQHIVYLPVEAPRADEVVYGSLFDFFRMICEEDAEDAFSKRHRYIIKRTAEKLTDDSVTVSFAGDDATETIRRLSEGLSATNCFSFANAYINDYSTSAEFIDTARKIINEQGTSLGIVFSPIKNNESNEHFISVAIADEKATTTFDFTAEADESDDDLLLNCIDKTMLMLYSHERLTNSSDPFDTETKSDKVLRKALFKAASIAVGASAIVSILVALIAR